MKLASKVVSLGALLLLTVSAAYAAPPVVVTIPNLSVNAGTTTTINVVAYDPDNDAITLTSSLPAWATLNGPTTGTGLVSTTITLNPTASDVGTFNGSVTATANGESATANFQITVNTSGSDEEPMVTAPATETVTAGSMLTFTVTASDAQTINSLTAASLPSGATFTANASNTSGTFTWTPTSGQTGDFNVVFTAANALSGSATTHIHVAAAGTNTPPVVTAPATETVTAGNMLTFTVSATDVNSDHVSLSASGLPSGANFTDNDNNTGTFTWTPTSGQTGTFTVTFTGNDGHGGTATATTVITVNAAGTNTPPVVTAPATETVTQGNLLTFTVSATDVNADHVTLTASGLPSGASFTDNGNNTGTFLWTPSSGQSGTFTVTFTGNDGHGGSATATTVITVNTSGGGGTFTASAKLLGAFNSHRKFLCFRITPDNHTFDVRNVNLGSVTLSFNGQTLTGRTSLDWECEGEDDDSGDCGDCDSQNSTCPSDTTNCSVTLKTCFSMTALRTFFGTTDSIATNLMNVTFTGTLSTGGTFTATMGNVKVAGNNGNNGDNGKGHDKHALHAKATPNPLNPVTKLTFSLTKAGLVRVSVFDTRGRFVKTLFEGVRGAGDQSMIWDGSDANSHKVSSGVYIFRIEAPEASDVQRVTVLK
ncbi:MAG: putative Ig domain-containing protein [Bacteroidota bacterium]